MKELTLEAFLTQVNDKVAQENREATIAEEDFRKSHDANLDRFLKEYGKKKGCGCPWCPKRPPRVVVQAENIVARALKRCYSSNYDD